VWIKIQEWYLHTDVYSNLFTIAKAEPAEVPKNQWLEEENVIHIYNGVLFNNNYMTYRKMDGTGGHNVKWDKPRW
jgi:hypothetical protein